MAARVAGSADPAFKTLRARARDVFETAPGSDPTSAYAAAELSRQLGDTSRARAGFMALLARKGMPATLVRWAESALAHGAGRQ